IELSNVALTDPASAPISLAQIVAGSVNQYPLQLTNQYLEWTWGNKGQVITPGERVGIRYEFINTSGQALDFYAEPDTAFDPYVNPYPGFGDFWNEWGIFHLEPGQTINIGLDLRISSYTPPGYQIQIPVRLYEQNTGDQLGEGVLHFPVEGRDTFAPDVWDFKLAGYVPVGQAGRFAVLFLDGGTVTSVMATVRDLDTREAVATFPLTDDGANGDSTAGDHWFLANFTPAVEADFVWELTAEDDFGNVTYRANEDWHRFSSRPFQVSGPLLLISGTHLKYQTHELYNFKKALTELGYSFDHWDGIVRWPNEWNNISLPDSATLAQYAGGVVVLLGETGWDVSENSKLRYMKDLGISLWAGGENEFGIRAEWGDNEFISIFEDYFGASYVSSFVGMPGASGLPGDPVANGLNLAFRGWHMDELDPAGGAISMSYGQVTQLAAAPEAEDPEETAQLETLRKNGLAMQARRMEAAPEEIRKAYFASHERHTGLPLSEKNKPDQSAPALAVSSSGSAAIRNESGSYKTYLTGFSLLDIYGYGKRVELTGRIMSWLYPEADKRLRQLGIAA
ncbi:MAG TPA: hypothetical protein VJ417_10855, partial [Candidatus Glassbacteria bacterium]|nr:hypothetical protein [Candidatus Glassbacteria bacterium]